MLPRGGRKSCIIYSIARFLGWRICTIQILHNRLITAGADLDDLDRDPERDLFHVYYTVTTNTCLRWMSNQSYTEDVYKKKKEKDRADPDTPKIYNGIALGEGAGAGFGTGKRLRPCRRLNETNSYTEVSCYNPVGTTIKEAIRVAWYRNKKSLPQSRKKKQVSQQTSPKHKKKQVSKARKRNQTPKHEKRKKKRVSEARKKSAAKARRKNNIISSTKKTVS